MRRPPRRRSPGAEIAPRLLQIERHQLDVSRQCASAAQAPLWAITTAPAWTGLTAARDQYAHDGAHQRRESDGDPGALAYIVVRAVERLLRAALAAYRHPPPGFPWRIPPSRQPSSHARDVGVVQIRETGKQVLDVGDQIPDLLSRNAREAAARLACTLLLTVRIECRSMSSPGKSSCSSTGNSAGISLPAELFLHETAAPDTQDRGAMGVLPLPITTSTRRFSWRPPESLLLATGIRLPVALGADPGGVDAAHRQRRLDGLGAALATGPDYRRPSPHCR